LFMFGLFKEMYKINDLKRLKKVDLEGISHSLGINSSRKLKADLISDILSSQVVEQSRVPSTSGTPLAESGCVVEFDDPCIRYTPLTDEKLKLLPTYSFAVIFGYMRSSSDDTFKPIDRAVKHTSSGDVSNVLLCQVSRLRSEVVS
jgi:hypothetical protein